MAKEPIVIVGGGRAAASLIDAYREAGGDALITVVSSDDAPALQPAAALERVVRGEMEPTSALVHTAEEYDDLAVELRLETTVESVDTDGRHGHARGRRDVPTDARDRERRPPAHAARSGRRPPAVHTFRTLADAAAVKAEAEEARKAVVVGGSFIGSEVAASLSMLGLEVTIVEMGERLVPALGSAELSEQVAELYREQGVELLLGEQIEEFQANGRMLTGARTASGATIEAFLAVVGVGVEPNVDFLEGSRIELDNGSSSTTTSAPRSRTSTRSATWPSSTTSSRGGGAGSSTGATPTPRGRISGATSQADERATPRCRRSSRRCSTSSCSCSATRTASTRSSSAGRSPSATGRALPPRGAAGRGGLVGQAGDMVEELKTLVREKPQLSDRSKLANKSSARPPCSPAEPAD